MNCALRRQIAGKVFALSLLTLAGAVPLAAKPTPPMEQQITRASCGHILANSRVWSPDGQWIVYDTRSDPAGAVFDGNHIEAVNVRTGETKRLFASADGAHCGIATFDPRALQVVFIVGPEHPTPDWSYSFCHRQAVVLDFNHPGVVASLDARDLTPRFTAGALRGGTHLFVWDAAGDWLSFTYNDALQQTDIRDVGVAIPNAPVHVPKDHPRNRDGADSCFIVTRTTPQPRPGSDEINRASEEAWIGANGYVRADGTRQRRAIAFQGTVITTSGQSIAEVFVADLPEELTTHSIHPSSDVASRPAPPSGVSQRRLTFTSGRKFPGLQGPRHWLQSSPDGARIALLMRDDAGIAQFWTISPNGGPPVQLTRNPWPVASAFTWSPDGRRLACVMDNSIFVTDTTTGQSRRVTARTADETAPRPEACVFSPDGNQIAFVRREKTGGTEFNQICVVRLNPNSETGMGGTGDPPVPSGHRPDGTGATLALNTEARNSAGTAPVPSGGSPPGTGQWPGLPSTIAKAASEFGFNQAEAAR